MKNEKVLVSACCAGEHCRYNGRGAIKAAVKKIKAEKELVCPEMLGGLPCPREGCNFKGRVIGRKTGEDFTAEYIKGAYRTLEICKKERIKKAYLLRGSPSCGKGYGVTARLLELRGIKVIAI